MFKRSLIAILIALAMVFVVAGCSSNSSSMEDETAIENEPTEVEDASKSAGDTDTLVGDWQVVATVEQGTTTLDMRFNDDGTFKTEETLEAGHSGEGTEDQATSTGTGSGTYKTDGDKLTLTYDELQSAGVTYDSQMIKDDLKGQNVEYTYKIDGDKLELTNADGTTETLTHIA